MELLRAKGFMEVTEMYSAEDYRVYRARHPGCPRCRPLIGIKLRLYSTEDSINDFYHEVSCLSSLQHHPSILQLSEHFYTSDAQGDYYLAIGTEWVECDLATDLERRRRDGGKWTEEEVLTIAKGLIRALADAEQRGIAHCAIDLRHLFLSPGTRKVKLGAFDRAVSGLRRGETLRRRVLPAGITLQRCDTRMVQDVISTDVSDLGSALLSLLLLDDRHWCVEPPDTLHSRLAACSDPVRSMLRDMMDPEPQRRLTFHQLELKYCVESHKTSLTISNSFGTIPTVFHQFDAMDKSRPCSGCDFRLENAKRPIHLPCKQCEIVGFCTFSCFTKHFKSASSDDDILPCTYCKKPLNRYVVMAVFGGQELFEQYKSRYVNRLNCAKCQNKIATRELSCGHLFCDQCLKVFRASLFSSRSYECEVCGVVSEDKPKKVTARKSLVGK